MTISIKSGIYIDGEWVLPPSKAVLKVENPATGELIASVPAAGPDETRAAIAAASVMALSFQVIPLIHAFICVVVLVA